MSELKDQFKTLTNDKTKLARMITKTVVRSSVSGIMVTLIKNHVQTETPAEKAKLYVGAWAIGGVVSESAGNWAADRMETNIELVKSVREEIKNKSETDNVNPE